MFDYAENYDEDYDEIMYEKLNKLELAIRKTIPSLWVDLCKRLDISFHDEGQRLLVIQETLASSISDITFTTYLNAGIPPKEASDLADALMKKLRPAMEESVLPIWGKEKSISFFTDAENN